MSEVSRWKVVLALLLAVVTLALAGWWARRDAAPGCALDGVAGDPRYRVRVTDTLGRGFQFCCVRCAELWLEARKEPPEEIWVTDESSGEEVEASRAWFVRSPVVTTPTSGNLIHVFRNREDAERHAATAGGRVLDGDERPFSRYQLRPR